MKIYSRLLLILLFSLTSNHLFSQDAEDYLKRTVKGKSTGSFKKAWFSSADSIKHVLKTASKYTDHEKYEVRYVAYQLLARAGKKSDVEKMRVKAVDQLIVGMQDKNASIKKRTAKSLQAFKQYDFSKKAKRKLGEIIKLKNTDPKTLLLAGWIGERSYIKTLDSIQNQKPKTNLARKQQWAATLASARLYDQKAVNKIKGLLEKRTIDSRILDAIGKDIIYTHHPELYDILIKVLQSDEKNCFSPNPDASQKIMCAYQVMELLAPAIDGFPIGLNRWGELETDNYEQALETCRKWFYEHMGDYTIKTDQF